MIGATPFTHPDQYGAAITRFMASRDELPDFDTARLLLARVSYTSPEHFTGAHLALFEADEAGRLCRNDIYDEDDLASALDALDARYVAGVGAEHAAEHGGDQGGGDCLRDCQELRPDLLPERLQHGAADL